MRIKICGITCSTDALLAAQAGADAIGMVCHADAPRCIGLERAGEIAASLPVFTIPVLLFVDAPAALVRKACALLPQAWLQFHGAEDPDYCAGFARPYLKACAPAGSDDIEQAMASHAGAAAVLADSGAGGAGELGDWGLIPPRAKRRLPLVLAGGLQPDNVAAAIAATDADAVDVSSGVCRDGDRLRKDPAKVAAFVRAARRARG